MYLDEVVNSHKRGEAKGIASICSAHPYVIKQTLKICDAFGTPPLIEATCNQVNQFGGYTGMTPKDFIAYVRGIAKENKFPFENIIFGGDHLGPSVWQNEPADSAMRKSEMLIHDYVQVGFTKLHLDCSMKLLDDPTGALDVEVIARRAAQLAKIAENSGDNNLRYVIGTEVPVPGGATEHEDGVNVTKVEDARQTIEVTREAFLRAGLEAAWEKVIGVVVQPGVEFGDDFVIPYETEVAGELSKFIESEPMIYEAHSTDFQTRSALHNLVNDHFAILKVGPGLTFAYREAVFALAMIEDELVTKGQCSKIIHIMDDVMLKKPEYWKKYYHGNEREQAFKRKYSLSDRIRYYWGETEVQNAYGRLMQNLNDRILPFSLLSQFVGETDLTAAQVIELKIDHVLENYFQVC